MAIVMPETCTTTYHLDFCRTRQTSPPSWPVESSRCDLCCCGTALCISAWIRRVRDDHRCKKTKRKRNLVNFCLSSTFQYAQRAHKFFLKSPRTAPKSNFANGAWSSIHVSWFIQTFTFWSNAVSYFDRNLILFSKKTVVRYSSR